MKLITQSPKKALKAFLKQKPLRSEIDIFKSNLITLLDKISVIEKRPKDESEEHLKNDLRDFLRDTYYRETNAINTKDKKDLVIHLNKTTDSDVGVIIEAKRPTNTNEMVSASNPNKKALHELILYYLDERNKVGNINLKQLVITNVNEWYIIDVNYFDKYIYRNAQIKKLYETKIRDKKDNPFFYEEIAKIVGKIDVEIPCIYFDIREYDTILRNNKKEDDRELSALLKILSPQHLLKIATPNDSNSLDEKFYKELLHIIGLEEAKEGSKNIIRRKKENRNAASLIETTIDAIHTEDSLNRLPDQTIYGENKEERIFNVSLELCITWINRILFLKLLEGQLITYHQGNKEYRFLNSETINDFDELFKLFHKVLAINIKERTVAVKNKYNKVPYLNSSLFEISELEDQTIKINALDNDSQLELINTTILKDIKKKVDKLPTLEYLFKFLDAYDFASEGSEDVQEDNKTIINASVLGKVFEKINGYKDGSIFTPAFITMYMCKESIRLAVVQKFNESLSENGKILFDKFEDLKNYTSRLFKTQEILKANEIINSLRICDPAVGSGHFLVSALNEIISIKAELGILADEKGSRVSGYEIEIINDELIITDQKNSILEYKLQGGKPINKEIQSLQKTLFHEKQVIIENCLFGVDINPNSVKICRLRLWIELLKNAYYKEDTNYLELETLPNIDINIKCGNSLISRFNLDDNLKSALSKSKWNISTYRDAVYTYKNETSRDTKKELLKLISNIKNDFSVGISNQDKQYKELNKKKDELLLLTTKSKLFDVETIRGGKKLEKEKITKLTQDINAFEKIIEEKKNNVIFKNAFEWRFEFPEVLNNNGDFVGFDLVIGNPPYVYRNSDIEPYKAYFKSTYFNNSGNFDLYKYFVEKAIHITKPNYYNSFIINSSFILQNSFERTRKFLLDNITFKILAPLGPNVFDEATVDSAVYLVKNNKTTENELNVVVPSSPILISETEPYKVNQQRFLLNKEFVFDYLLNDKAYNLVNRLLNDFPVLEKGFEFGVGINTGYIKSDLTSDKKIDKRYHPMVPGTGISRYGSVNPVGYIMYDKEFVKSKGKLGRTLPDEKFFKEEKILVVRTRNLSIKQRVVATIDAEKKYNLNRLSNIIARKGYNLYGLLGILNSSLYNWLYSNRYYDYEIKPIYLRNSPLCDTNNKELISLVVKVIEDKMQNKSTTVNEKKIDQIIYKLFDLNPDEIKIIETVK